LHAHSCVVDVITSRDGAINAAILSRHTTLEPLNREFLRSGHAMALLLLLKKSVSRVGLDLRVSSSPRRLGVPGGGSLMKLRWLSALLIVALVGWVGAVSAQQAPAPTQAPSGMAEKTLEGKVKAVDPAKKQVTLEDGTTLTVPPGVAVEWTTIKPGATVMVSYVETGQMKSVRKLEVKS
jgi:hypothetical protein